MPNAAGTMSTVRRFRERAAECVKLASASFDKDLEAQYRSLAEQYAKLAECEEVQQTDHSRAG
jgi:hypothetical protein